jgi:hypothetical protein
MRGRVPKFAATSVIIGFVPVHALVAPAPAHSVMPSADWMRYISVMSSAAGRYLIVAILTINPAVFTIVFSKCACCYVIPVTALILPDSACRGYRIFRRQIFRLMFIIWR